MASEALILQLQQHIDHFFQEPSLLQQALTAAAVDETNYDGNRRLAQLGEAMIMAALHNSAFLRGISRSECTSALEHQY